MLHSFEHFQWIVHQKQAYSEACQTYKVERFAKIVNGFFRWTLHLRCLTGSEYACEKPYEPFVLPQNTEYKKGLSIKYLPSDFVILDPLSPNVHAHTLLVYTGSLLVQVHGYYILKRIWQIYFVNYYQSKNHKQR